MDLCVAVEWMRKDGRAATIFCGVVLRQAEDEWGCVVQPRASANVRYIEHARHEL
jgi:hypothetical protein